MASRLGSWAIGLGLVVSFAGLCVLPAAFGGNPNPDLIPVGACLFSLGAVSIAGGIYLKARSMQATTAAAPVVQAPAVTRKTRSGCDLCALEAPAVFCQVHQLHLCGNCLAQHYDSRSCNYIPSSRKTITKTVRSGQAKARGA